MNVLSIFSKIYKGNDGEAEVLASIAKLLHVNENGEQNYFLIPKSTIKDLNGSREIDMLLLHPVLGIFAIEVKNWKSLTHIDERNDPFRQANTYQDLLLAMLKDKFGTVPINVEYRVVFPSITMEEGEQFFTQNPYYENFRNHTFFKEHFDSKDIFKRFFNASATIIPNKKTFLKIASYLVPTDKLKNNQEKVIPVITKDEILFFDQKQLGILNGYKGGFRVIRGVAGTGKTVILTNFVSNRLREDGSEKFLIICFNRNLVNATKASFGDEFQKSSVAVLSIMELLERIEFDFKKVGIDKNKHSIAQQYRLFESDAALLEFREKFHSRLQKKPIDCFLCDETQDMPAGFMRIIYEEIDDCIFFIDEAQRFYPYTMNTIADVFHHPKFPKVSMRGRVKNLKNVYRTPSNIARLAFEILSMDNSLNDYYKRSYYLEEGFVEDINMVLEDGEIFVGEWDETASLMNLLQTLPKEKENVVLTYTKKALSEIGDMVKNEGLEGHIKVMTMQSVKGLEAQNVIIHEFGRFAANGLKHGNEILYRQIYVLMTRAQERLYLSMGEEGEVLGEIRSILQRYDSDKKNDLPSETEREGISLPSLKLAKLKPVLNEVKDGAELVVAASQVFAIIGGLFSL